MPIWGDPSRHPRTGSIAVHNASYSPGSDDFKVSDCALHIARKGRFKSLGNGLFVPKGYRSRSRARIEGNTANERYHRAAYESSQRISTALWASRHRASTNVPYGQQMDLSDDALVKARFYRQDNLRFNREFENPQYGLSERNQRAVKCSRWAHYFNGVTELGAAPTGMLLKFSKLLSMPKRDEKSLGSQVRVCGALALVCAAVAGMSTGISAMLKPGTKLIASGISEDIHKLVASFSAIAALGALGSLTAGAASCMMTKCATLSPALMMRLQANQDKHLHRLYLLVNDVKDKPNAAHILTVALKRKIPVQFCNEAGQPILLSRLIDDVRNSPGQFQAKQAMQKTMGSYLTENSPAGDTPNDFLDETANKAELLKRENHVVAFTNLIEHVKLQKDPSHNFNDIRTRCDAGVENKLRPGAVNLSANFVGLLGFARAAESMKKWNSPEFLNQRDRDIKNPEKASAMRFCADNILNNPHQYGPLTRALSNMSEGLRVVNHGILLSLNYQLTRPFAHLAGRITERVFDIPNSRVTSFSIGRLMASSIWAVVDAFVLLSLAAGQGFAFTGPDYGTKLTFPLQVPMGLFTLPIAIISTAAQMTLVAVPAAILMWAAKGAVNLEGWKGNIVRSEVSTSGKSRETFRWT
ncbi:hypothetical protein [Limnobacter parvus]|uniref:Uncharacterized protein n=1 Tax=Limnobacter parvus TaxID=2939690 RepID=A0ABT1XGR9_9BURK|nr:hypothetical protein [Limnobacter parvus]MCR2746475.1 hypothetical protein [Limnobacter parvus]